MRGVESTIKTYKPFRLSLVEMMMLSCCDYTLNDDSTDCSASRSKPTNRKEQFFL